MWYLLLLWGLISVSFLGTLTVAFLYIFVFPLHLQGHVWYTMGVNDTVSEMLSVTEHQKPEMT